jgi:hypothetical protein
VLTIAAAVLMANLVDLHPLSLTTRAQDRVADVLKAARQAMGGDKLAAVKALSAEGPFRRAMGQRQMEGTITLLIVRPDRMRRIEEMTMGGIVGGPTIERTSTFNGTEAWDDMQNRAGGGPNMQIVMRGPGDGPGPGGPGGGPGGGVLTPEQIEQARARRAKVELQRWTVALLAESPQAFTDAGVAESPDGKADVLETKDESGRAVRLFLDQSTHLPLMIQYMEVRPRVMIAGGPGGPRGPGGPGGRQGGGAGAGGGDRPSQEEMNRRIEEMRKQGPPQPSQFTMHLGEYKKVDGVTLPHKIDVAIEGETNEEWTIEKYKINPSVKADDFVKPKK